MCGGLGYLAATSPAALPTSVWPLCWGVWPGDCGSEHSVLRAAARGGLELAEG